MNSFYTRRIKKRTKSYYDAPQSQKCLQCSFEELQSPCQAVAECWVDCAGVLECPRMPTWVLSELLIPMNDVDTGQQYDQTLSLFPRCIKWERFRAAKKLSEKVVCLSFRLYVCQTRAWWHNGRKTCPDFFTMRKIIYPIFLKRMVGGGDRFYLKFCVNRPQLERNRRFWTDIRS